jgi:hypothetical protein
MKFCGPEEHMVTADVVEAWAVSVASPMMTSGAGPDAVSFSGSGQAPVHGRRGEGLVCHQASSCSEDEKLHDGILQLRTRGRRPAVPLQPWKLSGCSCLSRFEYAVIAVLPDSLDRSLRTGGPWHGCGACLTRPMGSGGRCLANPS